MTTRYRPPQPAPVGASTVTQPAPTVGQAMGVSVRQSSPASAIVSTAVPAAILFLSPVSAAVVPKS